MERVKFKAREVVEPKKIKKSEAKKEIIPNAFIAHICKLGFSESDAQVLYKNKNDWMGMNTG